MTGSPTFIVLAWGLLWATLAESAAVDAPAVVRRIDVQAGSLATPPEVRISPGLSTTLFFDARIRPEQLALEGRERFQRFGATEDHLVLVPSPTFREGERLRLEVRFHDGAVPDRAVLNLVVDATRPERQVELYRHARSAASYRQEVEELRAGMLRLERQVQQLQRSRAGGEVTRESLVADIQDVSAIRHRHWAARKVTGDFIVRAVSLVRLSPAWAALRILLVPSEAAKDWRAAGAALTGAQGNRLRTLPPWQAGPLDAAGDSPIVIVLEEPEAVDTGRYTLELWDEGRKRTLKLEGLQAR
ncbi:DUF2381 family protein [Corallococcus macrosporus]|uniref:DUF2381 family protein n=1 Tax=Corallococcus macrosporus DSM 14697 TaxID=1189310 RepID=A0A250JSA5_9BACT|nr:DUF2381 family protein [Corallococcus macrosporus]ATB46759.1 hypothetical protein MYMAC_002364 [Corallococcus macrosporus DSM 14697]